MYASTVEGEEPDQIQRCPECGSKNLLTDSNRAELCCCSCGLVIAENIIDQNAEWRAFNETQRNKRARTGLPPTNLIHDRGLSTVIDWRNKDYAGRDIPSNLRAQIYRLRKWQARIRVSDAIERNLVFALGEIDRISSIISVDRSIREVAAKIYRDAVRRNLIRGRSIEGMVATSIYAACRESNFPRTIAEVSAASSVNKRDIGRNFRFIKQKLRLSGHPMNPIHYITRIISDLNLPPKCLLISREIAEKAEVAGLTSGRGPTGIAAACVYISTLILKVKRTQKDVAEAAQVTEVTVRNRFKEIVRKFDIKC